MNLLRYTMAVVGGLLAGIFIAFCIGTFTTRAGTAGGEVLGLPLLFFCGGIGWQFCRLWTLHKEERYRQRNRKR